MEIKAFKPENKEDARGVQQIAFDKTFYTQGTIAEDGTVYFTIYNQKELNAFLKEIKHKEIKGNFK